MRIISINVDGIHQAAARGLYEWLADQEADIICIQDLRCLEYETDSEIFHLDGYNSYFFDYGFKHYNGVAIYTRALPKALIFGFGFSSGVDMEGRYLQVDFDNISIGSLLVPSATSNAESQEEKMQFLDDLQAHLTKISRKRRDFIFCGDLGIAPKADDVSHPSKQLLTSGFQPEEQHWMKQLSQIGYIDAFRHGNADRDEYSWWPSGALGEGDAWRSDLQIVSSSLTHKIDYAMIYKSKLFSSHLPIIVDYDIELETEDL
jgi:exodeoxyribonuclease-3